MHRTLTLIVLSLATSALALGAQASLQNPAAGIPTADEGTKRTVTDMSPEAAPGFQLSTPRALASRFRGPSDRASALRDGRWPAEALASADFDEDGMPDLVVVHPGADGSGAIALHRGNIDAVYPNEPEARARRANGTFVDAPFLPDVSVFDTPVSGDLVGAGDFDADGHRDAVVARRGGTALFWHRGDGRGSFHEATKVAVTGPIAAMAIGDVNRRDGLEDIVVAVEAASGGRLLVFEGLRGALTSSPEEIPLVERPSAIALGRIDEDAFADLAVASAKSLAVIRGRDRGLYLDGPGRAAIAPPAVLTGALPSPVRSVVVGDFDGRPGADLALLDSQDRVAVIAARDLLADPSAAVAELKPVPVDSGGSAGTASAARLVRARVSAQPGDDLILLGTERSGVMARGSTGVGPEARRPLVRDLGKAKAARGMRLGPAAVDGLVLLIDGEASPRVAGIGPLAIRQVTNTNDSGPGSLRQTILDVNGLAGLDTIEFDIPGPGPHTIVPLTPLPEITGPTIIDGTSEPDYTTVPVIRLDGNLLTDDILRISGGGSTIRSLSMGRQGGDGVQAGIQLSGAGGNVVEGNYVGTNTAGTAPGPTFGHGVTVHSPENTIGGTVAAARNIVSGNDSVGILIQAGAFSTTVLGNYVGLNAAGTASVPNGNGINLDHVNTCTIGGLVPGARNVVANPNYNMIIGKRTVSTLVQGNYIGTNSAGTATFGLHGHGINIWDSSFATVGDFAGNGRNVIAGHSLDGIRITRVDEDTFSNFVLGNYIGVAADGVSPRGNGTGVRINATNDTFVGLNGTNAGNIISGNIVGVALEGTGRAQIRGNYIGLSASGLAAVANGTGVDVVGTNHVVGGLNSGDGNVISGNNVGIHVAAGAGVLDIKGNLIGTNPAGTAPIPNTVGIRTEGGSVMIGGVGASDRNVISGNTTHGIDIRAHGASVRGNFIGTRADGAGALGNGAGGVRVEVSTVAPPATSAIGDTGAGEANVIAHNGGAGVALIAGGPIPIRGNVMQSNGGLGIDLSGDGVTDNDPGDGDSGPNGRQNFPVINVARALGGTLLVSGSLNSTAGLPFTIDVYTTLFCDPLGHGEGTTLIGTTTGTTDGAGLGTFSLSVPGAFGAGDIVTATATAQDRTSEFSACRTVVGEAPPAVAGLQFGSTDMIGWDAAPGADFYNLYIGTVSTQSGLVTPITDSCLAAAIPQTGGTLPPGSNPPPGEMIWFLVTAANQFGEGPLQPASSGPRTLNSTGSCGDSCAHDICGTGGALDPACTLCSSIVCAKDPHCCAQPNGTWDIQCVQQVRTVCRSMNCAESQGQCPHSLCEAGGAPLPPGCDTPPLAVSCTAAVCQADPHCCQLGWDDACIARMASVCGYNCI